eukprot:Colp12_sorted_trinity150504_noHs@5940
MSIHPAPPAHVTVNVTSEWPENWEPSKLVSGKGILYSGVITAIHRQTVNHKGGRARYAVLHISYEDAYKRNFNEKGIEVEPKILQSKKIRTGYLHSSYDTTDQVRVDALSNDQVYGVVSPVIARITGKSVQKGRPNLSSLRKIKKSR